MESVVFFHYLESGDSAQVIRLGGKGLPLKPPEKILFTISLRLRTFNNLPKATERTSQSTEPKSPFHIGPVGLSVEYSS